jgi:thioredoxin-related protein
LDPDYTSIRQPTYNFRAGGQETNLEGHILPPLPGYHWADHQKTLVLAIRKGCHFCEESLPFYKRLEDLENTNSLHAHVLAVMPDNQDSGSAALQSGGVAVEGIFSQPLNSIQVTGTPTLLLLDAKGRVERAWIGQLTPQGEEDLIAAVEK